MVVPQNEIKQKTIVLIFEMVTFVNSTIFVWIKNGIVNVYVPSKYLPSAGPLPPFLTDK